MEIVLLCANFLISVILFFLLRRDQKKIKTLQLSVVFGHKKSDHLYNIVIGMARLYLMNPMSLGLKSSELKENAKYMEELLNIKKK